jgi:hypothetical protein
MNAKALKEWSTEKGDFQRSKDTDYETKFQKAKKENKSFEKQILLYFSLSGLGLLFLVLEIITKQ